MEKFRKVKKNYCANHQHNHFYYIENTMSICGDCYYRRVIMIHFEYAINNTPGRILCACAWSDKMYSLSLSLSLPLFIAYFIIIYVEKPARIHLYAIIYTYLLIYTQQTFTDSPLLHTHIFIRSNVFVYVAR